jgi:hypothetical protein
MRFLRDVPPDALGPRRCAPALYCDHTGAGALAVCRAALRAVGTFADDQPGPLATPQYNTARLNAYVIAQRCVAHATGVLALSRHN